MAGKCCGNNNNIITEVGTKKGHSRQAKMGKVHSVCNEFSVYDPHSYECNIPIHVSIVVRKPCKIQALTGLQP